MAQLEEAMEGKEVLFSASVSRNRSGTLSMQAVNKKEELKSLRDQFEECFSDFNWSYFEYEQSHSFRITKDAAKYLEGENDAQTAMVKYKFTIHHFI